MANVEFSEVGKVFQDGTRALGTFDLSVANGEFMVFVGPSGCGKTTALRMVAGLEQISEGEIRIGERVVNELAPRDRDVAMVFQDYALYPHMSVFDNMAFALEMRKMPKPQIDERVREIAHVLDLHELLGRKPRQLSGGQRQRVAMGRAIVRNPSVFLMDEPLSNLDAGLRLQTRAEIARIQHELNVTTIYVTHDQVEAMTMADRLSVLNRGALQQTDTPQRVYDAPANVFVATFIGSPPMNLFLGVPTRDDDLALLVGETRLPVAAAPPELEAHLGRPVIVGIRPEAANLADGPLSGIALITEALGPEKLVHVELPLEPVTHAHVTATTERRPRAAAVPTTLFVIRAPAATAAVAGARVGVALDPRSFHFFDAHSGLRIGP